MHTRRTLLALLAAAAATACSSPPALAVGSLVDVQIVDRDHSQTLASWRFRGSSYVAGTPGSRYAVRLTNRSPGRVLVVLSVDGVNAVSGETASTGQTGYVLDPWQSAEITGWRKSYTEAAAFYFTALPDSYAARTDRPENVGVIGAAVFRERVVQPVQRPLEAPPLASNRFDGTAISDARERRAEAAGATSAAPMSRPAAAAPPVPDVNAARDRVQRSLAKAEKLGTGHGEREYAPTTETSFVRATNDPAEVVQMRYDSRANLLASGVIPSRPRYDDRPQAFPGFVPDPQ